MRVSRNKRAPADLKKLAERVRLQESALRDVKRRLLEHKKAHREVFQAYTRLQTSYRNTRMRAVRLRRLLGVYHTSAYPLPPLLTRR